MSEYKSNRYRKKYRKKYQQEQQTCSFDRERNVYIDCPGGDCQKCGWNEAVSNVRKANIRTEMERCDGCHFLKVFTHLYDIKDDPKQVKLFLGSMGIKV